MGYRVLVIEDEHRMRRVLQLLLEERGYQVRTAGDGVEGLAIWQQWHPHVVLTDIRLPKADGMRVLRFKTERALKAPLIIMTAYGTIEMAVEAMKQGAFDYLTKPFDNEKVIETVRRAVEANICRMAGDGENHQEGKAEGRTLIGCSAAIRNVWQDIELVARTRTSVLITGESGTGKELAARAIHDRGDRRPKPFVKVNCSAIPKDLLESELFGHRKGSYTGAVSDTEGSFQRAHGGTIFLDEIGDLPLDLQPKLLHAVEEKTITPIGASQATQVDVKVVSATNRDIDRVVKEGRFRGDLFYRLNGFRIHLQPLRERPEDIDDLVRFFMAGFGRELGKEGLAVDNDVLSMLRAHDWPGNVRELRNVIERMVLSCKQKTIGIVDLPNGLRSIDHPTQAGEIHHPLHLEEQERRLIIQALEKAGGNQTKAASLLNITRNTLRYRIKKYGISES